MVPNRSLEVGTGLFVLLMAFRLVREALAERDVLLRSAPHIVWPLEFVLPADPGGRPSWMLRLGLLLSEIGRRNNIQVGEEELRRALAAEASRYPGREREVIEFYQKTPEALVQLRAPLYEDKVIDFIVEGAKVTERKVSTDELVDEEADDNVKAAADTAKKKTKAKKE